MLPWQDSSLQGKVMKSLPALCTIGVIAAAVILYYFWN